MFAIPAATSRTSFPRLAAATLIVLFALAPYLGFVKFDYQFYSTVCDRYAYLAMFGVALAVAALLDRYRHRALMGLGVACVIACAVLSSIQLCHWRDTQTLFEYTLLVRPDSLIANKVLGSEFTTTDPTRATKHFQAAIAARPDDPVVHYNYGNLLLDQKNLPAAVDQWQKAVEVRPRYFLAWNNLGIAAWRDRDFDRAAECFKRAIDGSEQSHTPSADAYQNLGSLQAALGDPDATRNLERALSINPNLPRAKNALSAIRKNNH
jgi:Tfp pilus assembly protein PilF